jgi:hypothetical protein
MNHQFIIIFSLFFLFSVLCLIFIGILISNINYFKNFKKEFSSLFVILLGLFIYSILGLILISYNLLGISFLVSIFLCVLSLLYYKFFSYFISKNYCPSWYIYVGLFYFLFFILFNFYLFYNFTLNLLLFFSVVFLSFIFYLYFILISLFIKFLDLSERSLK